MLFAYSSRLAVFIAVAMLMGCQNTSSEIYDQNSADVAVLSSVEASLVDVQKDLVNHDWTLLSAVDSRNKPVTALNDIKDSVVLSFTETDSKQIVSFNVGCNAIGGEFAVEDSVMFVDEVMGDAMYCGELNKAEQLLAQAMRGSSQLSITPSMPSILTQITEADKIFIWQGKKTINNQPAQIADYVFWEIDRTEQPCPDGTTRMCLEVRPIEYDSQGLKTSEGKWNLFAGEIMGYNHERDHSQIVRLKRFKVSLEAMQSQEFVYVLDDVVEDSVSH